MKETMRPQAWAIGAADAAGILGPVVGSMRYRSRSADWQHTEAQGFWVKPLFEDRERGEKTLLMKVDPGAWSPMHTHPDELEQIFVLEGSLYDQDATMTPGDYCCRAPDAAHEVGSRNGAIVLLVYTRCAHMPT
jgi:quercetin dioxygenase-like cupin family protein